MALPATDAFTDADATNLTTHSASWTYRNDITVVLEILSNALRGNTVNKDCMAFWNADSFNNDQYAQGTVSAIVLDGYVGVMVRAFNTTGPNQTNGYVYYGDSATDSELLKKVASTETMIHSGGDVLVADDVIRLEVSGTTLTPKKNGSTDASIGAHTDSSLESGAAGIDIYNNKAGSLLDDWEGGDLGGGTNYPLSFAGSMTSTGALSRVVKPVRAGTLSTSGALLKSKTQPGLAGTLTATGTLARQVLRPALAGMLTTSGTYAQTIRRALAFAGSLVTSGTLTRQVMKVLAGTLSATGALSRQVGKAVSGTLTTSGTLLRQIAKVFAGTLSTVGALVTNFIPGGGTNYPLSFDGSLVTSGALGTNLRRALSVAGSLVTSGAFIKNVNKGLGGQLVSSGGLVRQVGMAYAGTLVATGTLTKRISRFFGGVLATLGAYSQVVTGAAPVPHIFLHYPSAVYGVWLQRGNVLAEFPERPGKQCRSGVWGDD